MDLFYRELNTEFAVQRAAVTMPSLLGEVGGFMGLLLGCSMLTLAEFVDYLVTICAERMAKRKKVHAG